MVKVEIERNGKRETVDLRVKAKAGRDVFLKWAELQEAKEGTALTLLTEYVELLEQTTSDSAGIPLSEIQDTMDAEDKKKLVEAVRELCWGTVGFSKLFTK